MKNIKPTGVSAEGAQQMLARICDGVGRGSAMADLNKGHGSMQIVPRRSLILHQPPLSPVVPFGIGVELPDFAALITGSDICRLNHL